MVSAPNPWRDKPSIYLGAEEYEGDDRKKIYYHKFLREGKIVKASDTFVKYMEKIS
jgi:hypothetical protein